VKAVISTTTTRAPGVKARGHGHRHTSGHEHDFEPVRGLPEDLPAGEKVLWQGGPDVLTLAIRAFHLRKIAIYFGLLLTYQAAWVLASGGTAAAVLLSLAWPAGLALLGLGAVALLAYLSARTTVYTITNRRVVMRVGIVLTLAFNLPFSRITAAAVKPGRDGSGDISLSLDDRDHIAWLTLWPHARPWKLARPQPTFRCVKDAAAVGQVLAEQWALATGRTLTASAAVEAPDAPAAAALPAAAAAQPSPSALPQGRLMGQAAFTTR
jgi:hypothetical protein